MPKVSILVPIYNVEKYLDKCLDSLINQSLEDIEIICINDGSTDSSLKIIQDYAQKSKKIKIINKQNTGYGDSMNKGLELASGNYIGILESDDFTDLNMFEDLYNLAEQNNADIVISDFYSYWTKNNKTKKVNSTSKYPDKKIINAKTFPLILRNKTTIWSAIYKRELLFNNEIRFLPTASASYQDTSFRIKTISCADKIVCTHKSYVRYRQDNLNSSVKSKNKIFAICNEYDELTKFLNAHPDIKKYANQEKLINQWNGYMWNFKRIDKSYCDEFLEKFYNDFKEFYENGEIHPYFYKKVNKNSLNLLLKNKNKFKNKFINNQNILKKIYNYFRTSIFS